MVLAAAFLIIGCKPGVPRSVIQPGKMEDVLYDYHLALAMSNYQEGQYDSLLAHVYEAAVLKKHGLSKAEFDSAMVYYMRHTDQLHKIYESLSKRFEADMLAMGGSGTGGGTFSAYGSEGDTANVWVGPRAIILLHHPAFNHYSFVLKADTSFHAGDRMMLSFNSEFIYQEGMRDGVAVLAIRYANDSVASRTLHATGTTHYQLEIPDNAHLGIKEIKGYFLLNSATGGDEQRTTMKIALFKDIALVRMRDHNPPVKEVKPDTLRHKETTDTVLDDNKERMLQPTDATPIEDRINRHNNKRRIHNNLSK